MIFIFIYMKKKEEKKFSKLLFRRKKNGNKLELKIKI